MPPNIQEEDHGDLLLQCNGPPGLTAHCPATPLPFTSPPSLRQLNSLLHRDGQGREGGKEGRREGGQQQPTAALRSQNLHSFHFKALEVHWQLQLDKTPFNFSVPAPWHTAVPQTLAATHPQTLHTAPPVTACSRNRAFLWITWQLVNPSHQQPCAIPEQYLLLALRLV